MVQREEQWCEREIRRSKYSCAKERGAVDLTGSSGFTSGSCVSKVLQRKCVVDRSMATDMGVGCINEFEILTLSNNRQNHLTVSPLLSTFVWALLNPKVLILCNDAILIKTCFCVFGLCLLCDMSLFVQTRKPIGS